ncbi:MAG: DRTGG domain-containing protein [bacterium]
MAIIYVGSALPGEGKTGVAAAIARKLAYSGSPVRLVRLADENGSAAEDAVWFSEQSFAPGTANEPVASIPTAASGETLIVEGPLSAFPGGEAKLVVVAPRLKPASTPVGAAAIVLTGVDGLSGSRATAGSPVLVELGEDRTLAGFSVSEARAALNAEVLVEGDSDPTSDHLVIAPIGSDAGQPYLRRFPSKAVVVRFDKTDQHLAAIKAEPNVLILTGGRRPSDYLFDAASANGIPVLLSRTDTENTVIALEGIFDKTRFHGDRKLDRMAELLEGSGLFEALA